MNLTNKTNLDSVSPRTQLFAHMDQLLFFPRQPHCDLVRMQDTWRVEQFSLSTENSLHSNNPQSSTGHWSLCQVAHLVPDASPHGVDQCRLTGILCPHCPHIAPHSRELPHMVNEIAHPPIPHSAHQVHARQLVDSPHAGPLPDPVLERVGRYRGREKVDLGDYKYYPWHVPGLPLLPGPGVLVNGGGDQPSDLAGEGAVEIGGIDDHDNDGAGAGRRDHLGSDHAVEVEVREEVLGGGVLDAAVVAEGVASGAYKRPARLLRRDRGLGILRRKEVTRLEDERETGIVGGEGAGAIYGGAIVGRLG